MFEAAADLSVEAATEQLVEAYYPEGVFEPEHLLDGSPSRNMDDKT